VLIAPPFAEEMNKCRSMFTAVGHALREQGIATVIVDLFGTGDSEGEFRDASCAGWIDDLRRAAQWAAHQGWPIASLLCARLGCVLGALAARDGLGAIERTIFWQPVVNGEKYLREFLRVRVAASMMSASPETVKGLRQQLKNGEDVEIAGYELSSHLAGEIEGLRLVDSLDARLGALHWLEVVPEAAGSLSADSAECLAVARSCSMEVTARALSGESFWASTEVVRVPELVDYSVNILSSS
jgi:exosortase A-associated hydrolase 2